MRSEDGMTLFGDAATHYPTLAQDVFDHSTLQKLKS